MIYLNGSKPSRGRYVSRIGRISFISGWTAEKLCSGKKLYTAACRFINHYPDFMAMTKSGRLILVEAKGDYLDGDDSKTKLKLSRRWQAQAGSNYPISWCSRIKSWDLTAHIPWTALGMSLRICNGGIYGKQKWSDLLTD